MENRDFIITGLQSWDISIGSNAKDIALEISKKNRVLYINTPLDKINYYKGGYTSDFQQRHNVIQKKSPEIRRISDTLWVMDYPFSIWPTNSLPDGKLFDMANRMNNKKMYKHVLKVVKDLGFKNYILFMDNDIYRSFYAIDYLQPSISIYYRRDNMSTAFWRKHAPRLEPQLCTKSDLVATNSPQLAQAVKKYNDNSHYIGQGVELNNYNFREKHALPKDMESISRPIIGYVGWITSRRLDADLLYEIAKRSPQYSYVMVGKEDEYFCKHSLHTLSNVHFLGLKQQAETIPYMSNFDVCINPQIINEITIGNYPRKIDEYLALGKPVVATHTDTMEIFSQHVWNCKGADEYLQAITKALQETSTNIISNRVEFAHTHTWENSVNQLYSYINLTNK